MAGRSQIPLIARALALTGCGWTQYAGDSGHTGFARFETALTPANADQTVVTWRGVPRSGPAAIANGFV